MAVDVWFYVGEDVHRASGVAVVSSLFSSTVVFLEGH